MAGLLLVHFFLLLFVAFGASDSKLSKDEFELLTLTVATEKTDGFLRFQRSAEQFDFRLEILGMGDEWKGGDVRYYSGGGQKVELLKKALEPHKDQSHLIVLFTDSYDVVLNAAPADVVRRFLNFEDANVVFSAEGYCWPDAALAVQYPIVKSGKRYLNSGLFIGFAPQVYEMVSHRQLQPHDDDQLYYTQIFLDKELREKLRIQLDTTGKIFQNLNGAVDDVSLQFSAAHDGIAEVHNTAYNTRPSIIHGNGASKIKLNELGNYIGKVWSLTEGCLSCNEDLFSLENMKNQDLPLVTLAVFIERPTPFLHLFLERLAALDYPKSRLFLFLHNSQTRHEADVQKFLNAYGDEFKASRYVDAAQELQETAVRDEAIDYCLSRSCHYLFVVDSEAQLTKPAALKLLIQQNRPFLAPLLNRPGKLWSNFWGSLSDDGFYARSPDYAEIVQNNRRGLWNAPFVSTCYLIKSERLKSMKGAYSYNPKIDTDMSFAQFSRDHGFFMLVSNREDFGHLINADSYQLNRARSDMFELFDNRLEWEQTYLHPKYRESMEPETEVEQPCPDVYNFPLFSVKFCQDMIAEMENFGQWSSGANDDERLVGGYENVPTRDIHMNQVGYERHFLKILDDYVAPMQEKLFIGYYQRPPHSLMMFVVRYRPDEQPYLRPHHDASTYTIDVALNRHGRDYEGGGVRYLRYNCSVTEHQVGWSIIMPGRLTHLHEGLRTTKGTRYILISFVNP